MRSGASRGAVEVAFLPAEQGKVHAEPALGEGGGIALEVLGERCKSARNPNQSVGRQLELLAVQPHPHRLIAEVVETTRAIE